MKEFTNILYKVNNNYLEYNKYKYKSIYKGEKEKEKTNSSTLVKNSPYNGGNDKSIKNINLNYNLTKNVYCKKRANSFYNYDKKTISTKDPSKKIINHKSYFNQRNTNINNNNNINFKDNVNNTINNRLVKNAVVSRNNKNIFLNSNTSLDNNKLKKKIIINNRNSSNDNFNMNKKCINLMGYTQKNEESIKSIVFNTINNNSKNKDDNDEINYDKNKKRKFNYSALSLSQGVDKKKNNVIKITNNELTTSIDYSIPTTNKNINKKISDKDKDMDFNKNINNKKSYLYLNSLKNSFDSNLLYNNTEEYSNEEKNISRNKYHPIKLINDNTTINFAGSYNFHQYFNTIISNKNSDNIYNSNQKNNGTSNVHNLVGRMYNGKEGEKDKNKYRYYNTQLNSNSNNNKTNTLFISDKLIREISDIEDDMNKLIKQNTTNSKSRKYNTLKNSFEKLLKLLNNYCYNSELNIICNFLQRLLIGYHDVVLAYSEENLKLRELNYKLTEQYETIDKNLIECNRNIKEKQKTIEILENKISGYVNNIKNKNIIREYHINMNEFDLIKNKDEQNDKIKRINEQNLDDLDALYFFDKVESKPQRSFSSGKFIPLLPIKKKKNNNTIFI